MQSIDWTTNALISDDCFTAMGTRNTVCLGVGWCTVPCETNEDCLTGRCDVVQDDKTCLLYDPYERNDTIFAQSNALLIDVRPLEPEPRCRALLMIPTVLERQHEQLRQFVYSTRARLELYVE